MLVAIGASPRCGHRRLRRVLDPGHVPRLFALHEPLKDGQQEPRHTETDRTQCDLTTTPAGQRITIAQWCLQVFSWAFATLFIAGFTSAVRKT